MEEIFATLGQAGIERTLYLAWDFTVASERNLTERALSMRDDAFAQLGDTDLADLHGRRAPSPHVHGHRHDQLPPCGNDGARRRGRPDRAQGRRPRSPCPAT